MNGAGWKLAEAKKNGSRSPNEFGFRLPLRLIWDAVLLRFQRPLFRRPVSGPISLWFLVFRIIACAIMFRFKPDIGPVTR